ncbi:MAG: hypothetical protein HY756_03745 [Nitrospirae bacterium]|nr:hypothetical protein [Nitrospirota bacterium]
MLGLGELQYLKDNKKNAKQTFLRSLQVAESYGFKVEKGYAKKLLRAYDSGKGLPLNFP